MIKPGQGYGALLLHGFIGYASQLEIITNKLNSIGFRATNPALPGHGKHDSYRELRSVKPDNYLKWAETQLLNLSQDCPKGIIVIGFSFGGSLALWLAAKFPKIVKGIVTISTPVEMASDWLKVVLKSLSWLPIPLPTLEKNGRGHHKIYLASLYNFLKTLSRVKENLGKVQQPVLIIHAKNDKTINYQSSIDIYNNVSSSFKKLVPLQDGGHMVPINKEQEIIGIISEFISHFI